MLKPGQWHQVLREIDAAIQQSKQDDAASHEPDET
jgi:hypothetical protein